MTRKLVAILMVVSSLVAFSTLTGCNTVAGAGKDVERSGEAIHDTAKDVQQKM